MESTRRMVLVALRKEHRRYALRMCRHFERRGVATKLVTDVPALLAEERELAPDVIILDSALSEPRTRDVLASLQDRPDGRKTKLIVVGLPVDQEMEVRERWPEVDVIV